MSIVITGANGKLGSLIIEKLLHQMPSDQIIACVRQPERASRFKERGVEVRFCDYDRPESLSEAFRGAARLLLISSSHPDDTVRMRQHAHAIEAAKQAKVGHLLYTSFAFPHAGSIPLTHLHLATEHAILASGIPYTLLRNALYIDFVGVLGLIDGLASSDELIVPPGDWRFNSLTRDDLASGIASVLSQPDPHMNATYELTSPRPWGFEELALALSELTGAHIALRHDSGVDHWMYHFLQKIDTASTSLDLEKLMGAPAASLRASIGQILPLSRKN
ncbi:NAD(P)H-binding protein [Paenibacillus rigui]|uniref:NAD(P)-dependent oxidoreductase n=1 Tax=Paenibacillus rigui TaxID=554312 RepID=A0A229UNZ5_9BACL|nr:NAD(P)H-binding protein [Paenibacillus rigui]OXM85176.1 NAD(P)-dependent oxidoreductase [Paenibacillus rigui]